MPEFAMMPPEEEPINTDLDNERRGDLACLGERDFERLGVLDLEGDLEYDLDLDLECDLDHDLLIGLLVQSLSL
jgi:hypothetical protein